MPRRIVLLLAGLVLTGASLASCGRGASTPDSSGSTPPAAPATRWWHPPVGLRWAWQLRGEPVIEPNADAHDVDLLDVDEESMVRLGAGRRHVICYFSAGTVEDWRDDADAFPPEVIGSPLPDWDGERYLDVRAAAVRDAMVARLDLAAAKGCDAVEPDNVQGHQEDTGFGLTRADLVDYVGFLADAGHGRGLAVGLKNGADLVPDVLDRIDFALVEECAAYDECAPYEAVIAAGKPVLQAEYDRSFLGADALNELCEEAVERRFSTLVLPVELDGSFRLACG